MANKIMNVSGIKWLNNSPLKDETRGNKCLGKGFDDILATEMAAIKKPYPQLKGGNMRYQVLNQEKAMTKIFDDVERKKLYLIDFNHDGQLALYPVDDLSTEALDRDINEQSEFLYEGEVSTKARIVLVCENQQDTVYGTYDFNTPLEKTYVNELAMRLRENEGVVSTYVSTI